MGLVESKDCFEMSWYDLFSAKVALGEAYLNG